MFPILWSEKWVLHLVKFETLEGGDDGGGEDEDDDDDESTEDQTQILARLIWILAK